MSVVRSQTTERFLQLLSLRSQLMRRVVRLRPSRRTLWQSRYLGNNQRRDYDIEEDVAVWTDRH